MPEMTRSREWLTAYFDDVHRRGRYARPIRKQEVQFSDTSGPQPCQCHINVRRFVAENPGAVRVGGWLIMGRGKLSGRYVAHSVVRYRKRTFDITPSEFHLQFVQHIGTDDDFREMEVPFSELSWPPPAPDLTPSDFAESYADEEFDINDSRLTDYV
jgi:hypothetical protein